MKMKMSLSVNELSSYVRRQIKYFIPDEYSCSEKKVLEATEIALDRCETCFKHILLPGYHNEQEVLFSHLHMDQYATFCIF